MMKLKTELAGETFTFGKPEELRAAVAARLKEITGELATRQKALNTEMAAKKKVVDILKKKVSTFKQFITQATTTE